LSVSQSVPVQVAYGRNYEYSNTRRYLVTLSRVSRVRTRMKDGHFRTHITIIFCFTTFHFSYFIPQYCNPQPFPFIDDHDDRRCRSPSSILDCSICNSFSTITMLHGLTHTHRKTLGRASRIKVRFLMGLCHFRFVRNQTLIYAVVSILLMMTRRKNSQQT
jgi:hypothetical protein